MSRNTRNVLVLVAGLVLVAVALWMRNPATQEESAGAGTPTSASSATAASGDTIRLSELPPEARDTLELIETDGPFPYDRDGVVFRNDEGRLPHMPRGYYHEYTVETPGSADRGARRIISGNKGELYYTDHYASFRRIQEDR